MSDIQAHSGDHVVFIGEGSHKPEVENARRHLTVGAEYRVRATKDYHWTDGSIVSTDFLLDGIDEWFASVMFRIVRSDQQ